MPFCPKCGRAIEENISYCPNCGIVLAQQPQQTQSTVPQHVPSRHLVGKTTIITFGIICIILVVVLVGAVFQITAMQSQVSTLQNQLKMSNLAIGLTLETYYNNVRAKNEPVKQWWSSSSSYYQTSVSFAADLASHDIGNLYWPDFETPYQASESEHSYQTSNHIMQQAMALTGISSSDNSVTKIDKVLAFIHYDVHFESRLRDDMYFPCETLTFHSGDCTSFSILAAAMFEEAGIKSVIGFFTSPTQTEGHAMVLVHLDNLDTHHYSYYSDLTSYKLTSGKWIIIEPQCASLTEQDTILNSWVAQWNVVACAQIPYST